MPGWVIPPYNADPRISDLINSELAIAMKTAFTPTEQTDLTYRPIRPRELNILLTVNTESYETTLGATPNIYNRIWGAVADAEVPAGNAFLIMGWYFLDDPTAAAPIGVAGTGQIVVEGVIRNEVALKPIDRLPNNAIVTNEQEVIIGENNHWTVQIKGAANASVICSPLAYRIGPHSQLDQG